MRPIPTLRTLFLVATCSIVAFLSGCASAPVTPSMPFAAGQATDPPTAADRSRVVFVNRYHDWMTDPTARPLNIHAVGIELNRGIRIGSINVLIDGKPVGYVSQYEYVQVEVPHGKHTVTLVHPDVVVDWTDTFEVTLDQPVTHFVIDAGLASVHLTRRERPISNLDQWHRQIRK